MYTPFNSISRIHDYIAKNIFSDESDAGITSHTYFELIVIAL